MGTDGPEALSDIFKQLHVAPSLSGGNVDVPMIWTGWMGRIPVSMLLRNEGLRNEGLWY